MASEHEAWQGGYDAAPRVPRLAAESTDVGIGVPLLRSQRL